MEVLDCAMTVSKLAASTYQLSFQANSGLHSIAYSEIKQMFVLSEDPGDHQSCFQFRVVGWSDYITAYSNPALSWDDS